MANVAGVVENMGHGLNEANIDYRRVSYVGMVANNDTITSVFTELVGHDWMPVLAVGGVYSAGAGGSTVRGQRALTPKAFTITSYDESTGTLVITNTSGGNAVNPAVAIMLVAAGNTPS